MKRFAITILWRSFAWHLQGVARSGCDLIEGLAEDFPPNALVMVRCTDQPNEHDEARGARDREDYARDMEPYTRQHRDGDVTP